MAALLLGGKMNLIIRPLWEAERKYTYSQSSQITAQTVLIGHLRGAMETVGSSFLTSWDDHSPQLNTADLILIEAFARLTSFLPSEIQN